MITEEEAMVWLRAIANDVDHDGGLPDHWHECASVLLTLINEFVPRSEQVRRFMRGELGTHLFSIPPHRISR